MSNQTLLPIEKIYPPRFVLSDPLVSWDVEVSSYTPEVSPNFEQAAERLESHGVIVPSQLSFARLATLNNRQAIEQYGPGVISVRNPLGRTGINGTGIFYEAGESGVADMAILRRTKADLLEVAMVFNRNKWSLPGGFVENGSERVNRRIAALREAEEEVGLDLSVFDNHGLVETLVPLHVKPSSRRSVDMAYITNQVEMLLLPDDACEDELRAGDDAERAEWVSLSEVQLRRRQGLVSDDHFSYITAAFEKLNG